MTTQFIGKKVFVKMDRPLGTRHDKYDWTYPVNYGYVPETISGDGEELDVYVLGIDKPLDTFEGICIAVVKRTNDNDDKLIVVPKNKKNDFTVERIEQEIHFQEQWFEHTLILLNK